MEIPIRVEAVDDLWAEVSARRTVNLPLQEARVPLLDSVRIESRGGVPIEGARWTASLRTSGALLGEEVAIALPPIHPGERLAVPAPELRIPTDRLLGVRQPEAAELVWSVATPERELCRGRQEVELLPWDEWPADRAPPGVLAVFVLPDDPVVATLVRRLSGRAPPSGIHRLRALYDAIRALGFRAVEVPQQFEQRGLRVRLADTLLREQRATGVDLALLFAACLERMGAGALLTSIGGRLIPGAWLGDDRFPEGVVYDLPRIRGVLAADQLVTFDPLIALHDPATSFEAAVAAARSSFVDEAAFRWTLDVRAARTDGWRPLECRPRPDLRGEGIGVRPIVREILAEAATQPVEALHRSPPPEPDGSISARLRQWKDRLLDLSLRNRLLAFRLGARTTVPLDVADLPLFVERLGSDTPLEIVPSPTAMEEEDRSTAEGASSEIPPDLARAAPPPVAPGEDPEFADPPPPLDREREREQRRRADLERGVVHASMARTDLLARAVALDRASRLDLEEGGANTLYAAVGFLKWSEIEDGERPEGEPSPSRSWRMAPLLLIPVAIEIHRSTRAVRLRRAQEDPLANVTLVEKLRRDFDLDLSGIANLESEDHAIDVSAVLAAARAAIAPMRGWEVLDQAALGQLLFTKFLLWRDLEDNAALLLQSPVVQHIARRGHAPYPNPVEATPPQTLDDQVPPGVLPTVVDADSTQLAAIHSALQGRSFVLQGPPGTGKSQTITNLVAAAIATGRTVLVVAEKVAALDVVHRRLREAGLGDACLELHSHKANKRQVIQALAGSLRREPGPGAPPWDLRSEELGAAIGALNALVRALHQPRPLGLSFYQGTGRQLPLRSGPRVTLPIAEPAALTEAERMAMEEAAARFATTAATVEPVVDHPWADTRIDEWSASGEQAALGRLARALEVTAAVESASAELGALLGVEPPTSAVRLRELADLGASLAEGPLPAPSLDPRTRDPFAERVRTFVGRYNTWQARSRTVAIRWHPGIYKVDLERLALRFAEWSRFWFPIAFVMLWSARRELQAHARKGLPDRRTTASDLGLALQVEQVRDALGTERKALIAASGGSWSGNEPAELTALTERADRLREKIHRVRLGGIGVPDAVLQLAEPATPSERRKALGKRASDAVRAVDRWISTIDSLYELIHAEPEPDSEEGPRFARVRARLVRWQSGASSLREWALYGQAAAEMEKASLGPVVEAHRSGRVPSSGIPLLVERSLLQQWIDAVRDSEPALRGFSGVERHRQVLRFRQIDRQHLELGTRQVSWCLEQRLPRIGTEVAEASEPGILLREASKKSRQRSIRRLFQEIPNLLTRLKPCLLMSPLSVAQYLPAEGRRFDLVVFDEASQIGTHDAIGALARGAQVVVVGDSRQLPPTTYFQRIGGEDLADENDFDELESILDEAVAAGLPEQMLGWHYRSRHEDLIRFSNDHYYGGRLAVFPAARGRTEDLGLCWHPVPNGTYDKSRTRTNRIEAQALVSHLVQSLLRTAPGARTFGVVTFSQAQQILVSDLLDEARRTRPEIEPHFVGIDESVFVKNLENVQGDERDEILFSVGYGPDERGRVWMNFGPLNREGGERRLNVAVTRARRQLRVFSTLTHDQIDLSRTRARGARHLREFLRYAAEHGARGPAAGAAARSELSGSFEREVQEVLAARGFLVEAQVGCGAYRIDLAVHHPHVPGEYLLGVELDGESYRMAATARDRDRLRYQVLEGLGWRLHRIWSIDWWFDREREITRLERALDDAIAGARIVDDESTDAPAPEEEPTPVDDGISLVVEPYVELQLDGVTDDPKALHDAERLPLLREVIQRVVDVEAPLHVSELTRRVGAAFGVTKVTARAQKRVLSVARKLEPPVVVRESFVWPAHLDPEAFDRVRGPTPEGVSREVEHLPPEEVACAARVVLTDNLAMPHVDLVKETARLFGNPRVGRKVAEVMGQGIALLIERGHAEMQGERVVLRR